MARKPVLSIDSVEELGTEKLAKLVLEEAERSASFCKLVAAALNLRPRQHWALAREEATFRMRAY